jgi:hypothetical protein
VFHRRGSFGRSKYRIRRYGEAQVGFLERKLKTRGLLTLSVLKQNPVGAPTPVPARLKVYATNLSQQLAHVAMREVKEGSAVYYLGEFRVVAPDTLKFTATVEVAGEPKREMVFEQKFYK